MEDFCTECLVGILRSDLELLEEFSKNLLNIESDTPFNVSTQRTFYSKEINETGRVDLVFESQNTLCFVEMKVHSTEGHGQLKKYAQILSEQPNTVRTHLRYCTLYNEEKENLEQFRWRDIANFFKTRAHKNHLVREFYKFLKDNNMAGNERFNHEDLVGLKVYNAIATKVDGVFTSIKPSLKRFGSVGGGLDAGKHIVKHNRWAIYSYDIIGDKNGNRSEVLVSFDFKGIRYEDEPVVAVQIYVNKKNYNYKVFEETAAKYFNGKTYNDKKIFKKSDQGHGAHIRYEKPLALFFSEDEQLKAIQEWIENKLDNLMQFITENPGLDWKIELS